ncbi:MmgE/PrpD family protein [Chloroflexota bacterium]
MTIAGELASLVVNTDYKDIPEEVIEDTRYLIIDFVGAAVAGARTTPGKILIDYYKGFGGTPEATILGGGIRLPANNAAFLNSDTAHTTELECVGFKHGPNTTVVTPAALAIAEKLGLSGKEVLEAVIIGFEVQASMPIAMPGVAIQGWDFASVFGVLGAAATCAKLLRLDINQTTMALAIAASGASGFMEQTGTMTHFLEFGIGARQGLEAADLARMGFTAQEHIIEHPKGFAHAFSGGVAYDLKKIYQDFGKPFAVTQLSIKKYPCCYRTHRALDVVLQTMAEQNLSYDDVETIEADMNLYDAGLLKYSEPTTGTQSRFCMAHALAMAILDGGVSARSFSDETATSARAKEARSKVKVTIRTDWTPDRPAARTPVKIRLKDGRTFSGDNDMPRQPTKEELLLRHQDCCLQVLNKEQTERSTEMMLHLEEVDNITRLMDLLRG